MKIIKQLLWLLFALSLLTFSLGVSWQLSKSVNFFYGFWYQNLQIDATIKKNVVKNTYGKRDFPVENARLHQEKFSDIVQAIHRQGEGLDRISYLNSAGHIRRLLTDSEVVHLQDVANLLDKVSQLWLSNLLLLLFLLAIYTRKQLLSYSYVNRKSDISNTKLAKGEPSKFGLVIALVTTLPTGKHKLIAVLLLCLVTVIVLSLWGFTSLFYYLHTVIFPADHQWFFYYKDSLMATIMKAPDIFSAIAGQLLIIALLLAAGIDAIVTRFQRS
ncbi:lipoprotein intramolecular transacylase Lit [Cognaticolwellia mytili]|uniref:lipoprotein intramolecular transacylase Lit n=1 Tax=Cognaticolwellia mytili TaxID=1888913 RepID=UPI000A17734C|nr:DUF1461 domain-containing protein [Cognaticolwellia mytili]